MNMEMTEEYSNALKRWLSDNNFSLRKASQILGVNHNSIRNWLTPGAGINKTQWNKLFPYIEKYLTPSDKREDIPAELSVSYNSLQTILRVKGRDHLDFIEAFLSNYVELNCQ